MEEQAIFDAVKRNVLAVVPDIDPAAITPDGRLADLGCNSIDRADITMLMLDDLGIEVPVQEFADLDDLRSLVRLLGRYADGPG